MPHKFLLHFSILLLLWWTEVKFFCYVSIVIATVLSGVLCWGLVTHFILVSFVLVFGCHIYLTLCGLCFSLYICTAHYSILQFPVFVYPVVYMFCSHYVLQVATRWTQSCWALHLSLMLQFGYIIVYLCHAQQLVLFYVSYTLSWQQVELYLLLDGLGICAAWESSCLWIGLGY